jgi:Rrf2 family iron-sulfur cluster assembly transcriptional regulator
MRLSTRGRAAVMAMIDVALRAEFGPVPLNDIASRQHISLSSLEQLFSKLRLQGLVTSIRGPGGGYLLGSRTDSITVADILSAVDDDSSKTKLQDSSSVRDITQDLWDAVHAKVLHFTQSVTLRSLLLDQLAMGVKIERIPPLKQGIFKRPAQLSIRPHVPNSVFALGRTTLTNG